MGEDRKVRWLAEGFALLLLAFSLVLLVTNILPTRRDLEELQAVEDELLEDNRELEETCRKLELRRRGLTSDPQTQEAAFRETFRTGKNDEKTYRFEDDE